MPAWELTLRLLAVAAVFALAMWALRRYAARQPKTISRVPKSMRVVSKVVLGRGSQVVLVDVGGQPFLVGVNAQAVPVAASQDTFDEHAEQALALALPVKTGDFSSALEAAMKSSTSPRPSRKGTGKTTANPAVSTAGQEVDDTGDDATPIKSIPSLGVARRDSSRAATPAKAAVQPKPRRSRKDSTGAAPAGPKDAVAPSRAVKSGKAKPKPPTLDAQGPSTSASAAAVSAGTVRSRSSRTSANKQTAGPKKQTAGSAPASASRSTPGKATRKAASARSKTQSAKAGAVGAKAKASATAGKPASKTDAVTSVTLPVSEPPPASFGPNEVDATELPKLPAPQVSRDVTFSRAVDRYRQTISGPAARKAT